MAPVRSYTNWNSRTTDEEEQIEPYRKYFFICEGANTETWYFKKLIDIRKELNIHPLIDIRLLEKTEGDRDISFPRRLIKFAENQKENPEIAFDKERDKMIVVFDGDIFEEKVLDYDELVAEGEKNNILAVSNPALNCSCCYIMKIHTKMILSQMLNRLSRMKKMDIRHLSISCYLPEQESIRRKMLRLENWRKI